MTYGAQHFRKNLPGENWVVQVRDHLFIVLFLTIKALCLQEYKPMSWGNLLPKEGHNNVSARTCDHRVGDHEPQFGDFRLSEHLLTPP